MTRHTHIFLSLCTLIFLGIEAHTQTDVDINLIPFAGGFDKPVDIVHAGDERLFVVEKGGTIQILRPDGTVDPTPFLDITSIVISGGSNSERGLLGLAFHPAYDTNGYLYLNYIGLDSDTRIARMQVSSDPDSVDTASLVELMEIDQPFNNHNGGCLRFGPDGYLYIGMGDGGSSEDPLDYGQDMSSLLGKMLRIRVDGNFPYEVPSDNPFVGTSSDTLPEIWASGLRNPWRFSFDRSNGDLYLGDVGQYTWEEIDHQPAGSQGGENYGWRCYEGNHAGYGVDCPPMSAFVPPIAEYSHDDGHCSVTGGYVYRGSAYPELFGKYFYVDYCSGQFWSLEQDGGDNWVGFEVTTTLGFGWTCIGEDYLGELYAANQVGSMIYRIIDADCSDNDPSITVNADTTLTASAGNAYQWYLEGEALPLATFQDYAPVTTGLYTVLIHYEANCSEFAESVFVDLGTHSEDCLEFETAPVDLNKSFDPVNGVRDRVQIKWYKSSPEVRYTDEDAAACDIKAWAKKTLDPETGEVTGTISDPDTILLVDKKKFQADGITPREIFKWPLKFRADGVNNANRVDPNIRYQWQVRCACEHGEGQESPWSEVKIFNTPDFDPSTGVFSTSGPEDPSKRLDADTWSLRPYPDEARLVISGDIPAESHFSLFDLTGRRLEIETRVAADQVILQGSGTWSAGVYVIRYSSNGEWESIPFMVH
ncbi:MAG: hypothetical protein HKN79_08585 [Flavobacteriales bacterium]|nr:hypothetical protein [Flavobacteriales bacterium]